MGYIRDRLSDSAEIFKRTFGMVREHPKLVLPFIIMLIASLVPILLIGMTLLLGKLFLTAQVILICLATLSVLTYFINTFCGAINCWMVSQALKGKEPTFWDGFRRAMSNFFDILAFAIASFSIGIIASKLRSGGGKGIVGAIFSILMRSVSFIIEQGWTYAVYIVLPDMIISKRNFFESLKIMPNILRHIPEYLVGGFAFDMIMWVVNAVILLVCIIFFAVLWSFTSLLTALLAAVVLFLSLFFIKQVLYLTLKSTYFTVLYVELYEKGKLTTSFFKGLKLATKEVSTEVKQVRKGAKKFFK